MWLIEEPKNCLEMDQTDGLYLILLYAEKDGVSLVSASKLDHWASRQ